MTHRINAEPEGLWDLWGLAGQAAIRRRTAARRRATIDRRRCTECDKPVHPYRLRLRNMLPVCLTCSELPDTSEATYGED